MGRVPSESAAGEVDMGDVPTSEQTTAGDPGHGLTNSPTVRGSRGSKSSSFAAGIRQHNWTRPSDRCRLVATDDVSQQFGEGDGGVVLVERPDDLRADGETARLTADRHTHRGKAGQRRVRHPECLAVVRPLALRGRNRAFRERSDVVRKRGGEVGRTEEYVDVGEVVAPGRARGHAPGLLCDEHWQSRKRLTGFLKCKEELQVEPKRLVLLVGIDTVGPPRNE